MQIKDLSSTDNLSLSDLLAVYSASNSDTRKASITQLLALISANINVTDSETTQYVAPNATAQTVNIDNNNKQWTIITPVDNYADMTIKLPLYTDLVDKQEILITCTKNITTLTTDKNGATAAIGFPTSITANDSFRFKYDKPFKTWYKVV